MSSRLFLPPFAIKLHKKSYDGLATSLTTRLATSWKPDGGRSTQRMCYVTTANTHGFSESLRRLPDGGLAVS